MLQTDGGVYNKADPYMMHVLPHIPEWGSLIHHTMVCITSTSTSSVRVCVLVDPLAVGPNLPVMANYYDYCCCHLLLELSGSINVIL